MQSYLWKNTKWSVFLKKIEKLPLEKHKIELFSKNFAGWEWDEDMSDSNDKGCENIGDFEDTESFYADSEFAKDTPKQMPKALLRNQHPPGGRPAPTPDDFANSPSKSAARGRHKRPVSQCSTDSNFSSISSVIYGRKLNGNGNRRSGQKIVSASAKKRHLQLKDNKIYSTFKPTNQEDDENFSNTGN